MGAKGAPAAQLLGQRIIFPSAGQGHSEVLLVKEPAQEVLDILTSSSDEKRSRHAAQPGSTGIWKRAALDRRSQALNQIKLDIAG